MLRTIIQRSHGFVIGLRVEDGQITLVREHAGDRESVLEYLEHAPALDKAEEFPGNLDSGKTSELEAFFGSASASFMVAQVCNLRCSYCFAGEGDYGNRSMMSWPQAKEIVDTLFSKGREDEPVHFNFFGGEPMLNWPLIERTVAYAEQHANQTNRHLELSMTTNATRVTPDRATFLAEHGFSIMVSIDGTQGDHDRARPDVRGRGSWGTVAAGARMLLDTLGPGRVVARATLRAGHADYDELEKSLRDVGFKEMHLCVEGVHPKRAKTAAIPQSDWQRRKDHALAVAEEYTPWDLALGRRLKGYDPLAEFIEKILTASSVSRPCAVGDAAIAVDSDGSVFPCHRFVGDQRFVLAQVGQEDSNDTATRRFVDLYRTVHDDCEGCMARRFCAGNCAHEALERLDHGLSPHDPDECDSIRATVIAAVIAVARHVDSKLATTPVLLDRRALNAEFRAAAFRLSKATRARIQSAAQADRPQTQASGPQ